MEHLPGATASVRESGQAAGIRVVGNRHLSNSYRRGWKRGPVLSAVNLSIEAGDFDAMMGPSGSGKTTLLNLIAGIDKPDDGQLLVGGQDITRLSETALASWRAD